MLCQQITPEGEETSYSVLALDSVDAGVGDTVLIVQEGWSVDCGDRAGRGDRFGDRGRGGSDRSLITMEDQARLMAERIARRVATGPSTPQSDISSELAGDARESQRSAKQVGPD